MYNLYTDKSEIFECEVSVKNANLKGSIARLIVESDNINLVFDGKIENGKCKVPIKRLKGILDENTHGNMFLEVIIEDTYFKPWNSAYTVKEHTSVKVQVKEQKEPSKPLVEVTKVNNKSLLNSKFDQTANIVVATNELKSICEQFNLTYKNIKTTKKSDFLLVLNEYFKANTDYLKYKPIIIRDLSKKI